MKLRSYYLRPVLILMIVVNSLHSQQPELPAPEACCSAIIVGDLESASKWYAEALNFKAVSQFNNADRGIAIANMQQGTMRLELIEIANATKPDSMNSKNNRLQGLFKFGIRVKEFDPWIDHLNSYVPNIMSQVVTDPVTKKRMVVIRDPEGNRLQIFEE